MEIIHIKELSFQYPESDNYALDGVNLHVKQGEFVVIGGPSGCGKTTLLHLLKKEISPHGLQSGDISYIGKPFDEWDERTLIEEIGLVFQDPENQIIMDDVMQELVFGMENLGYSPIDMRLRLAEMVHTFSVEHLLHQKTTALSGGQKQLLSLLSALLLKPRVLLLDEPTSQLDPVAAKDLLIMLERLNKELGITVIIVEHRLEDLFDKADRVVFMNEGTVVYDGKSREVIHQIFNRQDQRFLPYIPSISQMCLELQHSPTIDQIPLNVNEGKARLASLPPMNPIVKKENQKLNPDAESIVELKDVYFQYEKTAPMVLAKLDFSLNKGDFYAVMGGNGSGKTTLLKTCLGLLKPQRGSVKRFGRKLTHKSIDSVHQQIAYLSQQPHTFFIQDTIEKEMQLIAEQHEIQDSEQRIKSLLNLFGIEHLRKRHPYDCSGGEVQKAALACMLLTKPSILFMDEPTRGLDSVSKIQLQSILRQLHSEGLTILMVTHDIEFTAQIATKCAMIFDGKITAEAAPHTFFTGNYFYTTSINRVTQNSQYPEVLTLEEVLHSWQTHELA
ncbi:ABC transporter ATP-binding protein [Allobacillus sp. GCM10007491]|uniref:ATP-binding cassette domain-containing protein n=1 Tax=Allobacillus saliphilus TaxID=2912308 RepID=A0A941HRR0_9BACI|nr:energy-coupling factor transporter ATPase [Allobacillus saliphilus]MBR7552866.1 ATP-binding cassette domain-containing protein [Allobacillus saliphilus]